MPLSFSNVQPNGGGSQNRSSLIGASLFTPPKAVASPFSLGNALQAKTKSSSSIAAASPKALPPISSTKKSAPVQQNSVPQNGAGLTKDQVEKNLANFYSKQVPTQNQGVPQASSPVPVVQNQAPVTGNTQSSQNLVGQTIPDASKPVEKVGGIPNNTGLYGQLLGQGIEKLQQAGETQKEAGLIRQAMQRQTRDVMGNPYYSGSVRMGVAGNIAQQQGAQLEGLAAQQNALTSQGNAFIQGAGQAAPVQVPYGNQYISPITGESPFGQSGGGQQNPQSQANIYANEVATGKRSYADAISAMGLYGAAGKQFLDQAIRQVNPNFNFAQAQTLGASQGMIAPNYEFAKQALANVEASISKLGSLQRTNAPIVNGLANLGSIYTGIGSEETRSMIGAVQTLRNAYASLLASAKGGTPTDYSAQAQAEIPDMPTPNDIAAIKHNFETLGGARVNIFGNPGSGNTSGGTSGGSSIQAGGFSFVQDQNGNWVPAK